MNFNPVKTQTHTVTYADVDRANKLKLSAWFALFQEVAIRHAEEHNIGAVENKHENTTWVLNRIRCRFYEYPKYNDEVVFKTWSTGVKKFKGYREFSAFRGGTCIAQASSLWLHVDIEKKAFAKIPQALIDTFPVSEEPPAFEGVEKMKPDAVDWQAVNHAIVSYALRYDDVDSNHHVNNTVYLSFLQSALQKSGVFTHPSELYLHFQNEINPNASQVDTLLELTDRENVCFLTKSESADHASGYVKM